MSSREIERIRWILEETGRSRLRRSEGRVLLENGDDAAVWAPPPGQAVVLTVDVQVEGVHFRRGWLTPSQIGARAVAASASDLAAMAARPAGILLSLVLPRDEPDRFFRALYGGALLEARRTGLEVLGGNLSGGPLSVTVTALGTVRPGRAVRRAGAKPGDALFVTGRPGRSRIGCALLSSPPKRGKVRGGPAALCRRAFTAPRARIPEALFLSRALHPHAMIDLSDGLARDLGHLLGAGKKIGATLDGERLKSLLEEGGCARLAEDLGLDPLETILHGGEDYELLIAAPPPPEHVLSRFRKHFGLPLTRIGTIDSRPGVRVDGHLVPQAGFDHFS